MTALILAIDQGTTSSRALLFDHRAQVVASARREHEQITPHAGWVEHDAAAIWRNVMECISDAMGAARAGSGDLAAIGVTNQRETIVVWDRATGRPIHNAIVWQDLRTEPRLAQLAEAGGRERFRALTGLPLAAYFSAAKIAWILDHVPGARTRAEAGELAAGTMDSWLIWNLTGRHLTDVTNASRTQLMNLATLAWAPDLLAAFDVPAALLPTIVDSSGRLAEATGSLAGVPVSGVLGDQQAALLGQGCVTRGAMKCTYGTGNFLLVDVGEAPLPSRHGLLATVAGRFAGRPARYALEGSIAVTGALVQWLRDRIGLIATAAETETLARQCDDAGGVAIVPAFSGLFAPHWRPDARGAILGLTGHSGKPQIARAALESVAWQTRDLVEAIVADTGERPAELRVDGGMTTNDLLMQIQADVLGIPIVRAAQAEATALGAAFAAGLGVGFWPDPAASDALVRTDPPFLPARDDAWRAEGAARWRLALDRSLGWA